MDTANRQTTLKALAPQLKGEWGVRILTQLRYLEEVNTAKNSSLDSLLDELTSQLEARLEADGALTKRSAMALEEVMAPASPLCKAITVSCVGHAHIDMNWMWRFDETAIITVDTFRTMLQLMREYPDFTFAQSQASVHKIIEDYAPDMLPEIRQRIREGRWEVTASHWVEPDKNMPNGESLARHLLYTKQYLKDLLGLSDDQFEIDFEPDTFGHGANVPEVLRGGGVKYMYHCRGQNENWLYRWQAPSGAQVTVFCDPTWYNDTITEETFLYVPRFCAKHGLDKLLHVYGVGDHGGGATRCDIERILEYNQWPCMPTIKFGRYIDFFQYIETLDLPLVERELNFIFDGCYTSQSRIKKANRIAEAKLFESELYNAAAHICGAYPYDAAAFGSQWKNVLFNHFHDILPGSGVIDTREYALGLFQETMAGAGTRQSAALRAIAAQVNTAALLPSSDAPKNSVAEGAGTGFQVGMDAGCDGFCYTASNAAGGAKRLFSLFNPAQSKQDTATQLTIWDWSGELKRLKITDEAGLVFEHELLDNRQQDFWGHKYFRVNVLCELPAFGYRTVLLEEDTAPVPDPAALPNGSWRAEGPQEYVLENAYVRATFDPQSAALVSFTDKHSGQEYVKAPGACLRYIEEDSREGMTAWRAGRFASDEALDDIQNLRVESTGLTQWLHYEASIKNSSIQMRVGLDKNARHLTFSLSCDWREFGRRGKRVPRLDFRVPLLYACDKFIYDNAFGVIERPARAGDVPGQRFAFAPRGIEGLMLWSDSKYGYRCAENAMSLALIRSSYDPDPVPEIYTHEISIKLGLAENVPQKLVEAAQRYTHAGISVACGSQTGTLPLTGSLMQIAGGEAVISSIKMAEDGSGMVVRLYNVNEKPEAVTLDCFVPVKAMQYADIHENGLEPVKDNKILCKAKGITTIKIIF